MPQPKSGPSRLQIESLARVTLHRVWGPKKGEKRLEVYLIARFGDEAKRIPPGMSLRALSLRLCMRTMTLHLWLKEIDAYLQQPLAELMALQSLSFPSQGHEGETYTDQTLAGDTRQISGHASLTVIDPCKLVAICGRPIDSLGRVA